tara:strand:+ start:4762 stop:5547 length:786 start_codon:yes stop_codon:yes gene_type:complete
VKGVWVSENLQKLIGVVVMAALVVVGVVSSSSDDDQVGFTRNLTLPGAAPSLVDAESQLAERVTAIERFLAKDQFVELTSVAQNSVDEIRVLIGEAEVSVEHLGQTDVDARRASQELLSALDDALTRLTAAADEAARQMQVGSQVDGGWMYALDLMCQQQLGMWGRTATRAEAVWDPVEENEQVEGFWACRYDNLNIPELDQMRFADRAGVCLPGDQPIPLWDGRERSRFGNFAFFADSINRWVFQYSPGGPPNWFDAICR